MDAQELKADLKRLSARAMQAKMDLHDLSEELPIDWERIPEVAQRAFDLFRELDAKRALAKQQAA